MRVTSITNGAGIFGSLMMLLAASGVATALMATAAAAQIIAPLPARDIAYIEIGGPGGLYSLNYERVLDATRSARVGGTRWDLTNIDGVRERVQGVIAGGAYRHDVGRFFGGGESRFVELGGAVVAGHYLRVRRGTTEVSGAYASVSPQIGLRHQPSNGFMFRAVLTPLLALVNGASAFPGPGVSMTGGVSIGWVFR